MSEARIVQEAQGGGPYTGRSLLALGFVVEAATPEEAAERVRAFVEAFDRVELPDGVRHAQSVGEAIDCYRAALDIARRDARRN